MFQLLLILVLNILSINILSGYEIKGELSNFSDNSVIYLYNTSSEETIDSSKIINSKFELRGSLPDCPDIFFLKIKEDGSNYTAYEVTLFTANDSIYINGEKKDFPNCLQIVGSKSHTQYTDFNNSLSKYQTEREMNVKKIITLSDVSQEAERNKYTKKIDVIDEKILKASVDYIKKNVNTYTGLYLLESYKARISKKTVQTLYKKLNSNMKLNQYGKSIEMFLKGKIPEIGDKYIDFEAYNIQGEKVKFSDLTGKYILLYFTSTYCSPCIQSVRELKEIQKTCSDSLVIVCFSKDVNKAVWQYSIERDKATWISLWDGKGKYSDTYIKYGVNGVPAFFLIGPSGKIETKWEGYGYGILTMLLDKYKNK